MYFEEPTMGAVIISAILLGLLIAFTLVVAVYAAMEFHRTSHRRTGNEQYYGNRAGINSQWLGGIEFNSVPKKQNWLLNTIKEVKEVSDYEKRRKESQFQRY